MPESRTVKGFSKVLLPFAEEISSQARYDHFDNSPYSIY